MSATKPGRVKFLSKQMGLIAQPGEGVCRVWLKIDLGALPRNFQASNEAGIFCSARVSKSQKTRRTAVKQFQLFPLFNTVLITC